jgi:hypothetical protein
MQQTEGTEPSLQPDAANPSFQRPYFTIKYNYLKRQEENVMVMLEVCDYIGVIFLYKNFSQWLLNDTINSAQ